MMQLIAGMPVDAADGPCGEVADIVVDPVLRRVTHLVVKEPGRGGHLVPVEAVAGGDGRLALAWTTHQVSASDEVEDTNLQHLENWPHLRDGWDVGIVRELAWPYHVAEDHPGPREARTTTEFDRIPTGTAEIRRESPVMSSDDELVGHVDGFVVDDDYALTHVVLEKGHFWGHRDLGIPVSAVDRLETDRVRLAVTRDAAGRFPALNLPRRHG